MALPEVERVKSSAPSPFLKDRSESTVTESRNRPFDEALEGCNLPKTSFRENGFLLRKSERELVPGLNNAGKLSVWSGLKYVVRLLVLMAPKLPRCSQINHFS
jgi:hypothetical protein